MLPNSCHISPIPIFIGNAERVTKMQTLSHGYRGLSLVLVLNWDRLVYFATIIVALLFGAWIGSH